MRQMWRGEKVRPFNSLYVLRNAKVSGERRAQETMTQRWVGTVTLIIKVDFPPTKFESADSEENAIARAKYMYDLRQCEVETDGRMIDLDERAREEAGDRQLERERDRE